jgi:hypothetical protein
MVHPMTLGTPARFKHQLDLVGSLEGVTSLSSLYAPVLIESWME